MERKKIYSLYFELSEVDYKRLVKLMQILGERTKVGVIRYLLRKETERFGDSNEPAVRPTQKLD